MQGCEARTSENGKLVLVSELTAFLPRAVGLAVMLRCCPSGTSGQEP